MTEPFTDDEARRLLGLAADTIDVPPWGAATAAEPLVPRRRWLPAFAAAAAVLLLVSFAWWGTRSPADPAPAQRPGDTPHTTGSPEPTPDDEPSAPAKVAIPDLVNLRGDRAEAMLRGVGLDVAVEEQDACASWTDQPVVVAQKPLAGTKRETGSVVTIMVTGGAAACDAVSVTRLLVDSAGGEGAMPGMAAQVDLLIGNELVSTVAGAELTEGSSAWEVCPSSGYYAEAVCPFSAWDVLQSYATRKPGGLWQPRMRGRVVHTPGLTVEPSACATLVGDLPDGYPAGEAIAIQPAHGAYSSCMEYFTVQVWTDESGLIRAVNLVLGSP